MKAKALMITIVVGLSTFIIGWFLHGKMPPSNQTKDTQMINGFVDTLLQADSIKSNNFAHIISGHFILDKSNCAGFNFINKDIVLWTNEIACNEPDTLKLRWLNDSTFMTRSTLRINEKCPPSVEIYKIVSFNGKQLTLKDIWTGWNDSKDETLKFSKVAD